MQPPCATNRGGSRALGSLIALGAIIVAAIVSPAAAQAATADELAKEASTQLRAAERDLFNGKADAADAGLTKAATTIEALKQDNPGFSGLNVIESRFRKLRTDVDRRLNRASPAASAPASGPAPAAAKPSAVVRSGVPAGDAMATRAAGKAVRDVDFALGKLEKLMTEDGSAAGVTEAVESKAAQAQACLAEAEGYLTATEEKYGQRLPSPNPEFATARQRIAQAREALEPRLAALRAAAGKQAAVRTGAEKAAAEALAQAERDTARMLTLHATYYPQLEAMTGNSIFLGTTAEEAAKALAQIETIEKSVLPAMAGELGSLSEAYGRDSMAISNRLFELGWRGSGNPDGKLAALQQAVANIQATRRATALAVDQMAQTRLSAFSNQLDDTRIKEMNEARALLLVAGRLDPDNAQIAGRLAGIDDQISAASVGMEKQIEARTWAGNIDEFPGPGSAKSLAAEALKFLRKDPGWGGSPAKKTEILAVAVRGPWRVAERDAFGRVTSWRLPIHAALTTPELRARGIARVFDLSIVAMDGPADKAPREPPFDGCWVGDSWMMRLAKL